MEGWSVFVLKEKKKSNKERVKRMAHKTFPKPWRKITAAKEELNKLEIKEENVILSNK